MNLAPITLFVYNRPWHTIQAVEALLKNELAQESDLIIYSDGPKDVHAEDGVKKVRDYIHAIDGFKSVTIRERKTNLGLADNIVDGVTSVVNRHGKIIVLEDDVVTSPHFLQFMNEALDLYKDKERVMHIAGYMFPIDLRGLPATVFYRVPSCWGWSTWRRAWRHFVRDIDFLTEYFSPEMIKRFNLEGHFDFWEDMIRNKTGKRKTWAILWYASIFLKQGLCLHPTISMTHNIGTDGSGTHRVKTDCLSVRIAEDRVKDFSFLTQEDPVVLGRIRRFCDEIKPPFWQRMARKIARKSRIRGYVDPFRTPKRSF